jgi:uncharacterized phage protein (TIGR02216 family)
MKRRLDWAGLMRIGLVTLRLAPDTFWSLTPAELMLIAELGPRPGAISRAGLDALVARFPDRTAARAERK